MLYVSDLMRSVYEKSNPKASRWQIYARSVGELNSAVAKTHRLWTPRSRPDYEGIAAREGLSVDQIVSSRQINLRPKYPSVETLQVSWPSYMPSAEYKTRSYPRILLDPELVASPSLLAVPTPVIKHEYCRLASIFAKRDYFLSTHDSYQQSHVRLRAVYASMEASYREGLAAHAEAHAAWERNPRDVDGELLPEPQKPAYPDYPVIPPVAKSLEQISTYYRNRIRHHLTYLLLHGLWVDSPETDPDLTPDQRQAYAELNELFRTADLGRNSYLNFSSNPGPRTKYIHSQPTTESSSDD